MTVSTDTNKISYTGTGANTALATGFPFIDAADLVVIQRVTATGVETTLTLSTHYTVTGGDYDTGTVTPVDGATDFPSTVTWTIKRVTPKTQLADYVENDDFGAETHENALDKATYLAIDRQEEIDRSLKVAATDADPSTIPNSVDRASKYLGFDANGDPIPLDAPTDTSITSAFTQTLLDDVDAATARATLGALEDVITARGDIVRGSAVPAAARLALGAAATYLRSDGSDPVWSALVKADVESVQGLPQGYLWGLEITRTSATEFNVGKGKARGGTAADQDLMDGENTNAAFGKLFDNGGWDAGDGGGGVPTAAGFATAIDTWHFFMLIAQDGSKVDFGWDTDINAANLLADSNVDTEFTSTPYYRRLHSFPCTATPDFADFTQIIDEIYLTTPVLDYNDVTEDISAGITVTLASVPDGVRVRALLRVSHKGAVSDPLQIRPSVEADVVSSHTAAPLGAIVNGGSTEHIGGDFKEWTNTSQQIFMRKADTTTDTYIVTRGWFDDRGKNA